MSGAVESAIGGRVVGRAIGEFRNVAERRNRLRAFSWCAAAIQYDFGRETCDKRRFRFSRAALKGNKNATDRHLCLELMNDHNQQCEFCSEV